jgi:hypothetical protein
VFAIEKLEEKCRVIRSGRGQAIFFDERDLLLQLGAQFFVVKGGVADDFEVGPLSNFFLLLPLGLLLFLLLLLLRKLDRALATDQRAR